MEELVEKVINKIKDITFEAKDFKEKGRISRGVKMAHEKVTEELKDLFGFEPASKRYGIDVLHRKGKNLWRNRLSNRSGYILASSWVLDEAVRY